MARVDELIKARVDELINLIRAANDIYLINPARNVRTAYILIDNMCELAIKSYLQAKAKRNQEACRANLEAANIVTTDGHRRSLQEYYSRKRTQAELETGLGATGGSLQADLRNRLDSHQPLLDWSGGHKSFYHITCEVKRLDPLPANATLHAILDNLATRHERRNDFYHDPDMSGLTTSEEDCLRAFCALYDLMSELFGEDYRDCLAGNHIARAQIAFIRLVLRGFSFQRVYEHWQAVVQSMGKITLAPNSLGHTYRLIYEDPQGFYDELCRYFGGLIRDNQTEIEHIDGLQRQKREQRLKRERLEKENRKLKDVVDTCLA